MFRSKSLEFKQLSGFIAVTLLVVVVGGIGYWGLQTVSKDFDICLDVELPLADSSMEGIIALISGRDLMGEFLLSRDVKELDEIAKKFRKTVKDFDQHVGYILDHGRGDLKKLGQQADGLHAEFGRNAAKLMEHQTDYLVAKGKTDQAMVRFDGQAGRIQDLLVKYEKELTSKVKIDLKVDAAMESKSIMIEQKAVAEEYMSLDSIEEGKKLRVRFEALSRDFDGLEKLLPREAKETHAAFEKAGLEMFDAQDQAVQKRGESLERMELLDQASAKAGAVMDQVEAAAAKGMEAAMTRADSASALALKMMIIGVAVGFLLAILLGVLVSRSISKPLTQAIDMLSIGSDQVTAASGEVSTASQSLAAGASEQAASIEETAAALEEMSSIAQKTAELTKGAEELMLLNIEKSASSLKSLIEMTKTMSEVERDSEKIGDIIKTIDEIAFQTNLLALNAAVEAARAGEAGAGFAVVADEVRTLAIRAAEAAQNTQALLEGTASRIKISAASLRNMSDDFEHIVESATTIGGKTEAITSASKEQAQGIEQINGAVAQVDEITQQNAANAEESASAAEELSAQAVEMRQVVMNISSVVLGAKAAETRRTMTARKMISHPPVKALSQTGSNSRAHGGKGDVKPEQVIPFVDDDINDF